MLAADSISLFASETSVPIVGIDWRITTDCFSFYIAEVPIESSFTKHSVLSRIARLFDPKGWLVPIVITAKIIMQSLWLLLRVVALSEQARMAMNSKNVCDADSCTDPGPESQCSTKTPGQQCADHRPGTPNVKGAWQQLLRVSRALNSESMRH